MEDRECGKGARNARGFLGQIGVSKVTRRGEMCKASACGAEKVVESVSYGRDRDEKVCESNGGGMEDAG